MLKETCQKHNLVTIATSSQNHLMAGAMPWPYHCYHMKKDFYAFLPEYSALFNTNKKY